jgi:uncharacterized membrane protein YkvA (DUF1232 family)
MKMIYYDLLKKSVEDVRFDSEDFEKNVLYLPDIFNLLANLLDEEIIIQEDRMLLNCALAYVVVPSDVIPEEVYGAKGFMDDLYVCCVVIKELYKKYPELMRKHWNNTVDEEEFDKVWDKCYDDSEQACDKDKILKYAGLAP